MMHPSQEIKAIPLWINGHAFLTMVPAFCEVRDARSGQARRRTPLCGALEAQAAATAARDALSGWSAATVDRRRALLAVLGDALAGYAAHFADLIAEESGKASTAAAAEVDAAVALLRGATGGKADGPSVVAAVIGDDRAPLLGPLRCAVPLLLAGAALIVKPGPQAPSAAFALAELTARSGFPAGVYNILHGDLDAVEALCQLDAVNLLACTADSAVRGDAQTIAARHGKPIFG